MASSTSDRWNNPQIPPPPPSPAVVGARFRDTSPTADPDYEARYPEPPVGHEETGSPTEPSPITRQPSISKSHHRSESIPKALHKKKRPRAPSGGVGGGEDPTPRQSRPHGSQPPDPGQYTNVPLSYYQPQYQQGPEARDAGSNGSGHNGRFRPSAGEFYGPGYYNNGYDGVGSYSPPTHGQPPNSRVYPPPPRDYGGYYGSSYPPAHYPHPLPTPPPVVTSMGPGVIYPNNSPSGDQAGYKRVYYESGNSGQGGGSQVMKPARSSQETKEGEGSEKNKQDEGVSPSETPVEEKSGEPPLPIPYYPSPPLSPLLPPPQCRPTGYPFLAQTLSATPSLQLYRRFSTLNHLVLLHLQDEISELENVLLELDEQEYIVNNGAGLRARRGMGAGSRRLQVMGAIAFKLQQYNKALKGYRDMNESLEPAGEEDMKKYRDWMEKCRPLVEVEGRVLIDHPEDLACLQRRAGIEDVLKSWGNRVKNRKYSNVAALEAPFSLAFKLGITTLSCGIAGLARWRVVQASGAGIEVPLALIAGATGGAAAMMWAFF